MQDEEFSWVTLVILGLVVWGVVSFFLKTKDLNMFQVLVTLILIVIEL